MFPLSILVADDDAECRLALGDVLRAAGYHTWLAESGLRAVELIRQMPVLPHLAVLDFHMPDLTGLEVVRMLRALGAAQASVIDFPLGYVGAFALGTASFAVSKTDAAEGFAYAWCENQTVAASRLVPLGQTAAQRVLSACLAEVPGALRHAEDCELRNLGRSVPGHGLVCMAHESQYSRLFLS